MSRNAALDVLIASGVKTLCWCWVITRRDQTVLGFTDHDKPLDLGGTLCRASSGMNGAELDQKTGFAVDHSDISGALNHDDIRAEDIGAGLYSGASLSLHRVNWAEPSQHALVWSGVFGRIETRGESFTAELLGLSSALETVSGRVFSRMCDARLFDGRCGLAASDFPDGVQCPRTFETCRDQFNNAVNFRGFPYLIGDDALQAGPEGELIRDGGSRYSS